MLSAFPVLLTTIGLTLAEQKCATYPNYDTKAYTYTVCNGTFVTDLESSRQFCKENMEGGDVVTFPNYGEYEFIIGQLNGTVDKNTFKYTPGFFQKGSSNRYNPETGDFYWIDDPETKITNESNTYWEPFRQLIVDFKSFTLTVRQTGTFLLDLEGQWYPAISVKGGLSKTKHNGDVICMRPGVPALPTAPTSAATSTAGFQYWIVITVAAAVIIIGIVLALIIFCVCKKTKHKKQKFQQVPQAENGNHLPQHVTV